MGARVPVKSCLNIAAWESLLMNYPDKLVLEGVKFGWPINFQGNFIPVSTTKIIRQQGEDQRRYVSMSVKSSNTMPS